MVFKSQKSYDLLVVIGFRDDIFYNRDCHDQPVPICLARSRLNALLLLHPTKCENLQKKGQFEYSDGLFFAISRTKREETENEL